MTAFGARRTLSHLKPGATHCPARPTLSAPPQPVSIISALLATTTLPEIFAMEFNAATNFKTLSMIPFVSHALVSTDIALGALILLLSSVINNSVLRIWTAPLILASTTPVCNAQTLTKVLTVGNKLVHSILTAPRTLALTLPAPPVPP